MFCEKCGAELSEGAAFCSRCGAEQRRIQSTEALSEKPAENPIGIEKIHFDIPSVYTVTESKKGKGPVFVAAGFVLVLVVTVIVLVVSIFGQANAKKVVEEAFQKTIKTLQEEAEQINENEYGYFFEMTGDYYGHSYLSDEITKALEEFGDIRIFLSGNLSEMDKEFYGSIECGMGDMKNIRINYNVEKDGVYLSLPDLYEKAFFVPQEFLEDTTKTDIGEIYNQESFTSLGNTLSDLYYELYEKTKCTKTGKETLTEYGNQKVTCYEVTVLVADYQEYLEKLVTCFQEDTAFVDWLTKISSREMAKEFLDTLQEEIESYQVPENVDFIILGNVYVDNKGRMVQLKIPFEDTASGELTFSFLGEERLSDYIGIQLHMDDEYSDQKIAFVYQLWDQDQLQSIVIDKKNSLNLAEGSQEEWETALIETLYHIYDGGYLPSQYMDFLYEMLLYLGVYEDEDYLNEYYENWENDYENWGSELTYSEDGNPILQDYLGNYQIELIAPPGTKLDLDWSYPEMICFMDEEEEQDYYYEITLLEDDMTDRFEEERSYLLEEEGYENIVFSEIMQKEINGYQVYYQYCSYDYTYMTGYKTYYAWVRLDEEYVFELYLDDYTNSVEDEILDGCFQAVLPIE